MVVIVKEGAATVSTELQRCAGVDRTDTAESLVAGRRSSLVVVGRGGMGKSHLLVQIADAARHAGLPRRWVRGTRLDQHEPFAAVEDHLDMDLVERLLDEPSRAHLRTARRQLTDGLDDGLLIVDNGHWIDHQSLELLASIASASRSTGLRMVVALRPRFGDPALAVVTEALTEIEPPVLLDHLDEDQAVARLRDTLHGSLPDDQLVELAQATAGSPSFLQAVALASAEETDFAAWLADGPCPSSLLESVRGRLAVLGGEERQVLLAMAFGASATGELSDMLELSHEDNLGAAVVALDDEGLLTARGSELIELVAEAATQLQPPVERRRHHRRFADALGRRGGSAVQRADHLVAAGAAPVELGATCLAAADELVSESPSLALDWIDRAIDAGIANNDVAARRVEAHLRRGCAVQAVRAAEPLFHSAAPGRLDALQHAAVAFVQTRRPKQAASILRQVHPRLEGDAAAFAELGAAICEIAAGSAALELPAPAGRGTASNPALEVAQQSLHALNDLIHASKLEDLDRAVVTASGAADLGLSALAEQRLPYSPDALAVASAVYCVDLSLAVRLARAARAAPATTDAALRSRALRAAQVEMWTGAVSDERDPLAEWDDLSPADRLVAVSIAAGWARRNNDAAQQRAVVDALHEVLLPGPDLSSIASYGEVMIAAAKSGLSDRVAHSRTARDRLVTDLNLPAVLRIHCAWIDVQCAALDSPSADLDALAEAVAALPDLGGRPSALRSATQTWCSLLRGEARGPEVEQAGALLEQLGYRWEATRLVGGAAMHLDDEEAAKRLLVTARELRAGIAQKAGEAAPLTARLSARELEVAELIVAGNTYKEIGALLYISPKTVEHHAARIRQRLDVTSRAELLELLRSGLGDLADESG